MDVLHIAKINWLFYFPRIKKINNGNVGRFAQPRLLDSQGNCTIASPPFFTCIAYTAVTSNIVVIFRQTKYR